MIDRIIRPGTRWFASVSKSNPILVNPSEEEGVRSLGANGTRGRANPWSRNQFQKPVTSIASVRDGSFRSRVGMQVTDEGGQQKPDPNRSAKWVHPNDPMQLAALFLPWALLDPECCDGCEKKHSPPMRKIAVAGTQNR